MNRDVAGRLDDLVGVVVAGRKHRARNAARDAAIPRAHELVAVVVARRVVVAPRFGRRPDRHAPIRRIDDERGLSRRQHPRAVVVPRAVVAAGCERPHLVRRGAILGGALLDRRRFCFGEERLVLHRRRALERRERGVGPDALQIRLAIRRARRRPCRRLRLRARRDHCDKTQNDNYGRKHEGPRVIMDPLSKSRQNTRHLRK